MSLTNGDAGTLFHLNLKVNTEQRGFNFKFHLKGTDYASVLPGAAAIAAAMKGWMPTDAEIFYAMVSMDNTNRESKVVRAALGAGTYGQISVSPPTEVFDNPRSALLVRLEIADGLWVSRKFNPLPDEVITDASLVAPIADITSTPLVAPAAPATTNTFAQAFGLFLSTAMFYSIFVQANHPPGGAYKWAPWTSAYVMRQSAKKGGRVFSS